jgi:hypothetical protein
MTDTQSPFDRIVAIWQGGEHLRAAALVAEQKFPEAKLEELNILCPGILEHRPGEPGEVRELGTVPGDPVQREMDRLGVDQHQVDNMTRQHRDDGTSPKQALAEADLKPAGTPRNDAQDAPTFHPHKAASRTAPKAKAQ